MLTTVATPRCKRESLAFPTNASSPVFPSFHSTDSTENVRPRGHPALSPLSKQSWPASAPLFSTGT